MEGTLLASLLANGFMIGLVVIMYRGMYAMNREIRMLKHFSSTMIDFTEEQTGKTTRQVQEQFTEYMLRVQKERE
jgi:hypothetical protein